MSDLTQDEVGQEFAKLFGSGADQLLVKADNGEDGPEIRIYWKSPTTGGVCNIAVSFGDESDDKSWRLRDEAFSMISEEEARRMAASVEVDLVERFG